MFASNTTILSIKRARVQSNYGLVCCSYYNTAEPFRACCNGHNGHPGIGLFRQSFISAQVSLLLVSPFSRLWSKLRTVFFMDESNHGFPHSFPHPQLFYLDFIIFEVSRVTVTATISAFQKTLNWLRRLGWRYFVQSSSMQFWRQTWYSLWNGIQ